MKPPILLLIALVICILSIAGCSALQDVAPLPAATEVPTPVAILPTATPEPTLGPKEFVDSAYCWKSHIDEGEYNLLRFFRNGTVVDVFVQPYQDCKDAWNKTKAYLTETSIDKFNHGEYHLSGSRIKFTLKQAKTEKVIGEVKGDYSPEKMLLQRQGAENWEYISVYGGK
jgi:hypothetical protein